MTFDKSRKTILVVDDEPEIREMMSDYLRDSLGYQVLNAPDGRDALDHIIGKHHVDLILSDINMPIMKGFDFLSEVRRSHPEIKRVLITAYNVEEYLEMAMKHEVGNIFVKSTPFDFKCLAVMLENLISEDIFGAQRYFDGNTVGHNIKITRGDDLHREADRAISFLPNRYVRQRLGLVLLELLTNAVFYGIRKEDPKAKENWNYDFELSPEEAIDLSVAYDEEKYAISVTDNGGRLRKSDVLYWLHRQVARDESGIPLGVYDFHGRGFFIARKYIDRLIVNIAEGRRTEVIIINYVKNVQRGSKPLSINEI